MQKMQINLIKGDKVGVETDYRDALPVNMVAINKPMLGANGYMLMFSGLTLHSESQDKASCRGGVWNERFLEHYRVNGSRFYSVDSEGKQTELGVVSGSEPVTMANSFNTQSVVAGGRFYLYDSANGFREVTDPDLGNPIDCVWVDGYYFFTDGNFLFHTDINNESSIDPLKFATAEFMPDKSLGLAKTQDNKVAVFGRYTTEYFTNTAQENFAFQRVQSRAIKIGIVGTHCKAEMGGKFYILGGRKEESVDCHAVAVGSTQKISTREVEKVIGKYSEPELKNAVVEAYKEDGYSFVLYHLPDHTLIFNETIAKSAGIEQAWAILKTPSCGCGVWRGIHMVNDVRLGKWIAGDRIDGKLGILDESTGLQYGAPTEWLLYTPFIYLESASVDLLQIDTIPGFTGSDDSSVFISWTKNGHTYGKEWREIYGDKADYGKRFIARRFGFVRDRIGFKMRGSTKSRMAFGRGLIGYG